MKVIKEGNGQIGWAKEYTCTGKGNQNGGCGAVLLVEHNDLFKTFSHSMGETDEYITFKCCQCGVLTDISRSDPPSVSSIPTRNEWFSKNEPSVDGGFEKG